jgi:prophage regulatory protein
MEIEPRHKLLRLGEVLDLLKMSKSSWYKGMADRRFPRPVKINPRTALWLWTEIEPLINQLHTAPDWRPTARLPSPPSIQPPRSSRS